MRRRLLAALVGSLLVATACAEVKDVQTVRRAVDRTESAPHVYRYEEETEDHTLQATVRVEDSFRWQTTVVLDETPMLEQIVRDDAIAIRLPSPDDWNPAEGTPLESVLAGGDWVEDPAGAPPTFQGSSGQQSILTDVGTDPLFDVRNALEYVRQVLGDASRVHRFNPDSLDYRPTEDPFRDLVEADEREGIERYIAEPPALPRTEEQLQRTPGTRFFRKLSVYTKEGRVVRALEVIDFESHEELRKAKERREPRFLLELLSALRRGEGEEPIRPRRWTLTLLSADEPVDIDLPKDPLTRNLKLLTESNRLSQLPGIELRAAPETTAPPLPTGLPQATPPPGPEDPRTPAPVVSPVP